MTQKILDCFFPEKEVWISVRHAPFCSGVVATNAQLAIYVKHLARKAAHTVWLRIFQREKKKNYQTQSCCVHVGRCSFPVEQLQLLNAQFFFFTVYASISGNTQIYNICTHSHKYTSTSTAFAAWVECWNTASHPVAAVLFVGGVCEKKEVGLWQEEL